MNIIGVKHYGVKGHFHYPFLGSWICREWATFFVLCMQKFSPLIWEALAQSVEENVVENIVKNYMVP